MFGRVVVNKPEMKFREFDIYRSYYCGICKSLKNEGLLCAMSLNYDMTFLALLLNSLYEAPCSKRKARCICHMCKKHSETTDTYSAYVSHMTILLSYYKCLDDFHDDKSITKFVYSLYLKPYVKKIEKLYPEKCERIKSLLATLSEKEHSPALEECANLFGEILSEVFTPSDDEWAPILRRMGFYLGKFIYIADAYEDIDDDIKKNRPNPLITLHSSPDFDKECSILLNMMAAECANEFEKLPLIENAEILRNIIYSGIWQSLEGDTK